MSKLEAYGDQPNSSKFILSYLSNRQQRFRVGERCSSWQTTSKGVPQGSVLDPMLFNVFVNDLFNFVETVLLTNYADDNTLSYANINFQIFKLHLEREAEKCIWWLAINCMKANPDKFQAILLNCESEGSHCLYVNGCSIEPSKEVALLGVRLDNRLVFNHNTNELCKKTDRQVNALKRLCHYISHDVRMAVFRAFIMSNFQYCPVI